MRFKLLWPLLGCLVLAGCPERERVAPPNDEAPQVETLPELEGEVTARIADWDEIQQEIAEHRGRVVVVDFWSTWCEPCMREFPHLVTLQRRHLNDVVCMSVNTNYAGLGDQSPEDVRPEAMAFLEAQGAKFPNFISNVPDEQLYRKVEIFAPPAVLVYDRDGRLEHKFVNDEADDVEFTYERDVNPLVERLLAR
jgi:thiol-disulfide isomerase/thioredoxin